MASRVSVAAREYADALYVLWAAADTLASQPDDLAARHSIHSAQRRWATTAGKLADALRAEPVGGAR